MGELKGKQLQPRDIAALCYEAGWKDAYELVVAVAVCLSESQGYDRAHNKNTNGSEDFGLFQINMDEPTVADVVRLYTPKDNVKAAFALYDRRGFQPWYGYTNGVYLHDSYIGRAVVGVANFLGAKLLAQPVPDWAGKPYTHAFTTPMADYHFRVAAMTAELTALRRLMRRLRRTGDALGITNVLAYCKRTRP